MGRDQEERPLTLQDVAKRVDLSVATVGRALGGYGRVSTATRERVLQAAREMNYHPNAVARGMKEQRTRIIGLIVGNIRNAFFSTIVRAVEDTVSRHGFNVIVCNTDEDPKKELAHAKVLYERRVDGLVVAPTGSDDAKTVEEIGLYYGKQIPTVFVDRFMEGVDAPGVYSNNLEGGYEATRHLLALGHRRIGVIVGKRTLTTMADRIRGYHRALAESGIELDEALIVDAAEDADVGVQGGHAATQRLLRLRERPSALLAMNNLLVIGVLRALREVELRVPQDLSILTWDDFELASYLTPQLTVMDQPTYSMGALAAERLMSSLIEGGRPERLEVLLKPRLIVRESTARVDTGADAGAARSRRETDTLVTERAESCEVETTRRRSSDA